MCSVLFAKTVVGMLLCSCAVQYVSGISYLIEKQFDIRLQISDFNLSVV